jgi:competence protein ComEA
VRIDVVGGCAAAILAGWALVTGPDDRAPAAPTPCPRPVLVDDGLHCQGITTDALVNRCAPETRPILIEAPRSGDRILTERLCGPGTVARLDPGRGWTRMSPSDLARLEVPLDLNEADIDELTSLRGVGPILARRIADARPFARPDDLVRVRGVGPVTLANNRHRLSTTGVTPETTTRP